MKITINKLSVNEYFQTTDLSLAGVISLYYPLEFVDRTNFQKAQFVFKRDENLDKLVDSYWRSELSVEPQHYFAQLRFIKSRLYENNND